MGPSVGGGPPGGVTSKSRASGAPGVHVRPMTSAGTSSARTGTNRMRLTRATPGSAASSSPSAAGTGAATMVRLGHRRADEEVLDERAGRPASATLASSSLPMPSVPTTATNSTWTTASCGRGGARPAAARAGPARRRRGQSAPRQPAERGQHGREHERRAEHPDGDRRRDEPHGQAAGHDADLREPEQREAGEPDRRRPAARGRRRVSGRAGRSASGSRREARRAAPAVASNVVSGPTTSAASNGPARAGRAGARGQHRA